MNMSRRGTFRLVIIAIGVVSTIIIGSTWFHPRVSAANPQGSGPNSSQPVALSWDDSKLAVANPDANTVTIFQIQGSVYSKGIEVPVGKEPWGVAFSPDATRLYVANRVDGTVSVLSSTAPGTWNLTSTIPVGVEPFGMVLSASGNKLYVSNTQSNSISVIDITANQVTKTIQNVGPLPRGLALTHGAGITDSNQVLYVTDFLALPSGSNPDGFDNAKAGFVTAISVASDSVIANIKLPPVADTGFKAAGDALQHIAAPANPVASDFTFTTGAYPNQLNGIATHGNFAYVPNTAASPDGPVRFNVNTQSLVNVINLATNQDAGQTINIQSAVGAQTNATKLFVTQPWAVAFKNNSNTGYVVSAASNVVVKLAVDATTGKPTVQMDPSDSTRVQEIPVGRNPRGIVIDSTDSHAYVMNYISRDVTVIDLTQSPEFASATLASTAVPQPGTPQDKIQIGKELFNTSVGVFDPPAAGQGSITGRMSNNGWGSCASCHPEGLTDNVVWIFASGPRRTVPLHATFAPGDPTQQRALNWSAIFDEVEDFEGNIRNVSGGLGIFVQSDGVTQATAVGAFTPAAAGQKQLTIRNVGGWDAMKAYIQSGIRAPLSSVSKQDPDVVAGRTLFIQSNCQSCHGTSMWTTSRVRFTPPPSPALIQNTELIGELKQVGTFDRTAANEVRATAAAPLGADGFNPPSLLSLSAFPQTWFHGGAANTLDIVLTNVAHRTSGTGGSDYLTDANARAQLVKFLLSIDANSQPIDPSTPPAPPKLSAGGTVSAANFKAVSPGSIASVFGTGLATTILADTQVPLPKSLGGTSLNFGSAGAAFFFVSGNQLNVQIPWEAPIGTNTVTVNVGGNVSTTQATVVTYAPGIFSVAQTGAGQGIIVGPGNVLAAPLGALPGSQPVHPGDYITIYCTGLGPVVNQPATGAVASASPLPATPTLATANIGGANATVIYSGLTPGSVGLYQVNAQIPSGISPGDAVPVTIAIGGVTSNTVTLAVAPPPVTFFSTGNPDGLIATLSRPPASGSVETETADDFVLTQSTLINGATFIGLLPPGTPVSSITDIEIEIYRVFPLDSANPPSGKAPTRVNSPSDTNFGAAFESSAGTLTFTASILNPSFTVANTVVNGIQTSNPFTGGEGATTGEEVLFTITFTPGFVLPADHYFFRPEVALANGNFLWLSAPKPILAPGTPFSADLQSWTRTATIAPDWIRIGTDITHQGPFNAAFSLSGQPIP